MSPPFEKPAEAQRIDAIKSPVPDGSDQGAIANSASAAYEPPPKGKRPSDLIAGELAGDSISSEGADSFPNAFQAQAQRRSVNGIEDLRVPPPPVMGFIAPRAEFPAAVPQRDVNQWRSQKDLESISRLLPEDQQLLGRLEHHFLNGEIKELGGLLSRNLSGKSTEQGDKLALQKILGVFGADLSTQGYELQKGPGRIAIVDLRERQDALLPEESKHESKIDARQHWVLNRVAVEVNSGNKDHFPNNIQITINNRYTGESKTLMCDLDSDAVKEQVFWKGQVTPWMPVAGEKLNEYKTMMRDQGRIRVKEVLYEKRQEEEKRKRALELEQERWIQRQKHRAYVKSIGGHMPD
jgi:hypothetical protein